MAIECVQCWLQDYVAEDDYYNRPKSLKSCGLYQDSFLQILLRLEPQHPTRVFERAVA